MSVSESYQSCEETNFSVLALLVCSYILPNKQIHTKVYLLMCNIVHFYTADAEDECSLGYCAYKRFRSAFCLHHQGGKQASRGNME